MMSFPVLGSVCLLAIGLAVAGYQLAVHAPAARPNLGVRGLKRARALERSLAFRVGEPTVRYLAAWVPSTSFPGVRKRLSRLLLESGSHLGLSASELLAASFLAAASVGLGSVVLGWLLDAPAWLPTLATVLGGCVPIVRVRVVCRERAQRFTKALPGVIELAAMCMSAGLDLPRTLRQIVASAPETEEPVFEELEQVLRELDLGRTRRDALTSLAQRVPTPEVRELVNSVVQSEEKGTPLERVLTIQARTLRLRRSAAAEQAASGAALMLVGPMTLIFACVIVLLMGPVVLRVVGGGFGPG